MTQRGLGDLNDALFEQLARLSNKDLSGDRLDEEVRRAEAMVSTADRITENAKVALAAAKLYAEHGQPIVQHLPMIGKSTT